MSCQRPVNFLSPAHCPTTCASRRLQTELLSCKMGPILFRTLFSGACSPVVGVLSVVLVAQCSICTRTAVSLSPAVLTACSALHPLEEGRLRSIFIQAGVSNFDECYASVSSGGQSLQRPRKDATRSVEHVLAEVERELMTRLAIATCSPEVNNTELGKEHAQNLTDQTSTDACQAVALRSALRLLREVKERLDKWNLTCVFLPLSSPGANTTILECVSLLSEMLSLAERACGFVNMTSHCIVANCSDAVESLDHDRTLGWDGVFSPLRSLVESCTSRRCAITFIYDTMKAFNNLESLESRFREVSFPKEKVPETNSFVLTVSQQATLILCYSLFPSSKQNQTAQAGTKAHTPSPNLVCGNNCHQLRNILNNAAIFLRVGEIPVMSYLQEKTLELCDQTPSLFNECTDVSTNLTLFERPSALTPQERFCLSFSCPFPHRATTNEHHWIKTSQDQLAKYYKIANEIFPAMTRPFNGSQLPCGRDCVSVYLTADEENIARTMRSVQGAVIILTSLVAIVAYLLNRSKLDHTPRRLNVYVNIVCALGVGVDQFLAGFSSIKEKIVCYSDGTLRRNEPNSDELVTACVIFSTKTMFCITMAYALILALSREWYLMTSALANTKRWSSFLGKEKVREKIYVIASVLFALGLAAVPVFSGDLTGLPTEGSCRERPSKRFFFRTIPYFLAVIPLVAFLCVGLPKLYRVYKDVKMVPGLLKYAAEYSQQSSDVAKTGQSSNALLDQLKLLTIYVVVVVVSLVYVFESVVNIRFADSSQDPDFQEHVQCMMASCYPETCPRLPSQSLGWEIFRGAYVMVFCVVFTLWAFNWKAYWKKHIGPLSWQQPHTRSTALRSFLQSRLDAIQNDEQSYPASRRTTVVEVEGSAQDDLMAVAHLPTLIENHKEEGAAPQKTPSTRTCSEETSGL